jgi:hypothetical protein
MNGNMCKLFVLALGFAGLGCAAEGEPLEPKQLGALEFRVFRADVGIHPSRAVLEDPNNPFSGVPSYTIPKWEIQSAAPPVAAFYAWATVLAREPNGENQWYAAINLHGIVTDGLAPEQELDIVRQMAIGAYQAVLDFFPDSMARDAQGNITFDFATPSVEAIYDLGGTPAGGWVLVQTSTGNLRAIRP